MKRPQTISGRPDLGARSATIGCLATPLSIYPGEKWVPGVERQRAPSEGRDHDMPSHTTGLAMESTWRLGERVAGQDAEGRRLGSLHSRAVRPGGCVMVGRVPIHPRRSLAIPGPADRAMQTDVPSALGG